MVPRKKPFALDWVKGFCFYGSIPIKTKLGVENPMYYAFSQNFFSDKEGRAIQIRPARVEDAEMIIEAINQVAAEKRYLTMERFEATDEQERAYIANLADNGDLFLVALHEDRIIGTLTALRARGKYRAHVAEFGLSLLAEYRNSGIGSQLIAILIRWCTVAGIEKLNLEVFHDNARAIALYQKIGFRPEGIRKKQIKIDNHYIDLIQMTLFITEGKKDE